MRRIFDIVFSNKNANCGLCNSSLPLGVVPVQPRYCTSSNVTSHGCLIIRAKQGICYQLLGPVRRFKTVFCSKWASPLPQCMVICSTRRYLLLTYWNPPTQPFLLKWTPLLLMLGKKKEMIIFPIMISISNCHFPMNSVFLPIVVWSLEFVLGILHGIFASGILSWKMRQEFRSFP